jgi:hypothetical protein
MYDVKRTITGTEPVTPAEIKAYILNRYDPEIETDVLLSTLLSTARELAEQYCNRSFIEQEIEYTEYIASSWTADPPEIILPFPNHLTVEEVKVSDVVTTDYTLIGINRYTLQFTGRCYSTESTGVKYYIKYTAGECTTLAKTAIMQICKDMYENRGKDPLTSNGFMMLNPLKIY